MPRATGGATCRERRGTSVGINLRFKSGGSGPAHFVVRLGLRLRHGRRLRLLLNRQRRRLTRSLDQRTQVIERGQLVE